MTHVVMEACINCRYGDCVAVCPVDCFHAGPNFIVIDPQECIDCALCIPTCPCSAICVQEELPADQSHMLALNAELSGLFPAISAHLDPLPDADAWMSRSGKLGLLRRS